MRKYKFRARTLPRKNKVGFASGNVENGWWVYGELHAACERPHIHTVEGLREYIDPNTAGEFSSVYDIDGKEIYEDDIIYNIDADGNPDIYRIVWSDECAAFVRVRYQNTYYRVVKDCGVLKQSWVNEYKYKVLGNAHDNGCVLTMPLSKLRNVFLTASPIPAGSGNDEPLPSFGID